MLLLMLLLKSRSISLMPFIAVDVQDSYLGILVYSALYSYCSTLFTFHTMMAEQLVLASQPSQGEVTVLELNTGTPKGTTTGGALL